MFAHKLARANERMAIARALVEHTVDAGGAAWHAAFDNAMRRWDDVLDARAACNDRHAVLYTSMRRLAAAPLPF